MTTWASVEVGTKVIYDGGEYADTEHIVRVLKRQGRHARVVLEPCVDELAAKIGIRVLLTDEVELPEGAESPDRAGKLIEEVLGGIPVATADLDGENVVCPKMDVTLIAAHLKIMHGVELRGLPSTGEDDLLRIHEELHAAPFHEPDHPHTHEGE